MIVVRREDVSPGGRYAGGRFAPPVPEGEAHPRPAPSPRELRERACQRIQDQGYLRAQRTPEENRALAIADAMHRLVQEVTPLLSGFAADGEPGERDIGLSAPPLPDAGQDNGPAGNPFVPREGAPASASGLEGVVDVAGRGKLIKLLLDLLKEGGRPPERPPAGPNPNRTPPSRRPENETPAPVVQPKPDRPLERTPDQVTEPLRDALHDDRANEDSSKDTETESPERIRETIRQRVAEKFRLTARSKVEIPMSELGLAIAPRRVILEFVGMWRDGSLHASNGRNATVQLELAPVSEDLAAEIKEKTDIDVSGYSHAIDTQGLNHAFGNHDEFNEFRGGQVPITGDTVSKFLDVVSDPRNVHAKGLSKSGRPVVVFRKRINGHYWFVASIQTGRKRLALFSHWITKAG
ncbi:MAG: hypothetical protein JJ899_14455 [Alphaproteobacteria bacterium]|nr:hypothetical protein [Alphaproteobacteria bacterium]